MNRLLIIDGNSLMHRGFHATKQEMKPNSQGEYINAVQVFDNMLRKAIRLIEPTHVAVCFDKRTSFRNKLYPAYKEGRAQTPEELIGQFDLVKDYLKSYGVKWFDSDEYEADDLIGSLSRKFFTESCILTSDHDLLQLVDFLNTVYLIKTGTSEYDIVDVERFKEKYNGLSPEQLVDYKAIIGDKSDNIPGIKGIGEVGALSLLNEYSSLENVYNHLGEIKTRTRNILEKEKTNAKLSYSLAKICTDANIKASEEDLCMKLRDKNRYAFCKKHEFF